MGPLAAPVWIAGLWACSRRPQLAVYRAFPIAYAILFVFFVITHGKAYYLTPIYPGRNPQLGRKSLQFKAFLSFARYRYPQRHPSEGRLLLDIVG